MHQQGGTLAATDITIHRGADAILERVSLAVTPGSRIGVVGPNGRGKTTLLRALAGLEPLDGGSITRNPPSLRVGYLPQERDLAPEETLASYLARRTGVGEIEAKLAALESALESDPHAAEAHAEALERFLALGGADFEARARGVLADVGLDAPLDRPAGALSGGEKGRAALASILLARFDVFLLDEPTNDLDFAGLDLLERFLLGCPGRSRARLPRPGAARPDGEPDRRARVGNAARAPLRRRLERVRGGARAWARRARACVRALERGARALHAAPPGPPRAGPGGREAGKPPRDACPHVENARGGAPSRVARARPGREALAALGAPARSGTRRGARAISSCLSIAPSWSGLVPPRADRRATSAGESGSRSPARTAPARRRSSTGLLGRVPLTAGTRRVGPSVVFGEIGQARALFAPDEPLLGSFCAAAGILESEARTLLAKFDLYASHVLRPAGSLSPGERTRAELAVQAARGAGCLVLDEPTNHLDLPAVEELERALGAYDGTLILVTHDRRFLEQVGVTRVVELSPTAPVRGRPRAPRRPPGRR